MPRTLLLALAVLLAACAAPAPAPTPAAPTQTRAARPTASPAPTVAATRTPRATPAPPTPTPDGRPLLIWAVAPEAQRDTLVTLLEEIARAMGVSVLVVGKSADGLSADLAAGSLAGLRPPDLIWGGADDLFLLKRAGALQPAADGLDDNIFLPAALAGASADGQRWGTPVAARGFLLLLYNRKLAGAAPRTTDELLAESRRLTGGGRYGLVAGWVEMRWLEAWLRGFGGASVGADGSPRLDTPAAEDALALLASLRDSGPPPPSTYGEGARLFREGRAAFAIDGDWALESYRGYTETLELGYAPLPIVSATGRPALAPLEGVYLMYSAALQGGRLREAGRLGALLTRPAVQARLVRDLRYLPALRDALRDPALAADPALAVAARTALEAPGIPPTAGLRCAWEAGEVALPPLLLDEADPEETAARLQQRAEACVAALPAP